MELVYNQIVNVCIEENQYVICQEITGRIIYVFHIFTQQKNNLTKRNKIVRDLVYPNKFLLI